MDDSLAVKVVSDRRSCSWLHGRPDCKESEYCIDLFSLGLEQSQWPHEQGCYVSCEKKECPEAEDCRVVSLRIPAFSEKENRPYHVCLPAEVE